MGWDNDKDALALGNATRFKIQYCKQQTIMEDNINEISKEKLTKNYLYPSLIRKYTIEMPFTADRG